MNLLLIIIVGALLRIIPHPPNVSPVGAIAIWAGMYLPKRYAVIVPLASMVIADVFIGFHSTMVWVYGSFVLISLLSMRLRDHRRLVPITLVTISGSWLFYLVTNFGVWVSTNMYPKTFAGLLLCYEMGLPFLRMTMIGDVLYTALFVGGYAGISAVVNLRGSVVSR